MGRKLPGKIQSLERQSALPSPFHYTVKTESVLPTKYKRISFGYGIKSNSKDSKLSPGPGDYNLTSFTDRFRPSIFRQTRSKQKGKFYRSLMTTPRDCSMATPLTGGVFDPMGVVTKKKTPGFNYPPLRPPQFFQGNASFSKTDGFRSSGSMKNGGFARASAGNPSQNAVALPEMGTNSEASSISK